MKIFNGKARASQIKEELKKEVENLNIKPQLAVLSVGDDTASEIYIKSKKKAAEEVGVSLLHIHLQKNVSTETVSEKIKKLNADESVDGIILQLPIPKHLDAVYLSNLISEEKDVDGFTGRNLGKGVLGQEHLVSCTPLGILDIIEQTLGDPTGLKVTVIGRSNIVGKPLALELINKGATVTVCNRNTPKDVLKSLCLNSNIVVVATGQPNTVSYDELKNADLVIDVGINRINSKIVGDVAFHSLKLNNFAGIVTPVPGGVGPMTVVSLLSNTIKAAKHQLDCRTQRSRKRYFGDFRKGKEVINLNHVFAVVEDYSVRGNQLANEVGISSATLSRMRSSRDAFFATKLSTLKLIQQWIDSKKGQQWLEGMVNKSNERTAEFIKGNSEKFGVLDLEKIKKCIEDPEIKTGELHKEADIAPMERSLFRRSKRDITSMTLNKALKVQKWIDKEQK